MKKVNDTYKHEGSKMTRTIDRESSRKKLFGGTVVKTTKGKIVTDFGNQKMGADSKLVKQKTVYDKGGEMVKQKTKVLPMSKIAKFI